MRAALKGSGLGKRDSASMLSAYSQARCACDVHRLDVQWSASAKPQERSYASEDRFCNRMPAAVKDRMAARRQLSPLENGAQARYSPLKTGFTVATVIPPCFVRVRRRALGPRFRD